MSEFEWEEKENKHRKKALARNERYDPDSTDEETKEIEKSQRRKKMDQALKTRKEKLQLLEKYAKVYGSEEAVEMVKKLEELREKRAKGREEKVAMLERQREQRGRPPHHGPAASVGWGCIFKSNLIRMPGFIQQTDMCISAIVCSFLLQPQFPQPLFAWGGGVMTQLHLGQGSHMILPNY